MQCLSVCESSDGEMSESDAGVLAIQKTQLFFGVKVEWGDVV